MAFIEDFATVKIQCHTYLPPGTILVSPDIWKSLRETYGEDGEEGRDRAFLRALGITTLEPGEPPKGPTP